jgi:hypothetical protein
VPAWPLTDDLARPVSELLTPADLARATSVCRAWYRLFDHEDVWRPHCRVVLPCLEPAWGSLAYRNHRCALESLKVV